MIGGSATAPAGELASGVRSAIPAMTTAAHPSGRRSPWRTDPRSREPEAAAAAAGLYRSMDMQFWLSRAERLM